ncbi:hypothetical protein QDK90_11690, partial [Streptomyces sp. 12257]|nr:hypothetical protein [Streptomyces sp. 12257]
EPPRSEREAPQAKSRVPKESGPGAAPRGPVGTAQKTGPTTAAGPGAAPSVAQAAVSPAAEQTDTPGQTAEAAAPRPEASLEKDGGGCAPPAPAPEKDEGGQGSCGGGGGEGAAEEKQPEPPDVSGQDPKAAVQTVGKLAPDQAAAAMPGVDKAADKKIGEEQQRLDAAPPTKERPSGAPETRSGPPEAAPAAAQVTGKVEKLGPEDQAEKQKAKGGEKAEGRQPAENVPPPPPPAVPDKGLSEAEAANVEAAADAIPTTDPVLENKTVGPAPKIRLEGASDPTRTDDQAGALKDKQSDLQATGREDAAKPLGEDQIFPNAPREQLTGKASGGDRGKGGGLEPTPAAKAGVGAVAKQEKGSEIVGASGTAQSDLGSKEKEHQQGEQQAKQEKQTEIDREVERNTAQQTAERGRVAQETQRQRTDWRAEQDKKIEDADRKSEDEHGKSNKEIVKARDDKDKEVAERKDKDNAQIDTERENAEKEAEKKKQEEKPSGGLLGWIADKVADFFKGLLEAVTKVFEAARAAVNGIIDKFKEWANAAIDFVRDLAVKAINALADVLIAIGDVLLAAFPELRDRFRKAIEGLRDAAIAKVNELAEGLKKAVNTLLDALAAGLNALLTVLEAGLKAVIKAYQAVIVGAIKFAQAAIEALGKFAALVADIAPDPGGWISKAGSSAKTGITDHLWGAIKVAVKQWFDTKVEGILGLGRAVIDVLVKGCVSIKQIGKMAWDAIIASLPMMIASLVIEKVVSMIVPAAGAILTIVQGLMAAWQSVSSILSAFGKFWAYLKAVKAGPAACLFAEAVAAGVVALLDFITNFLLQRLSSATKGVGKRLKAMSQKILEGLKKTAGGAKKAAGAAVNSARGALRNARQKIAAPAAARRPKGEASPDPKSPVKPKDTATPKGPAKPEPTATKPKDTAKPARDKAPDSKSQAPSKKKEIEGPKPTKPRKPKSPAAKALSKAKGAVKSALKKAGNAAKTLGRKLKKTKVGKALKNGASKLRNLFRRKKDRLREDKRRQHEQKRRNQDRRRKDEKSKESKEARLQKIVARIRPQLRRLLSKGVRRPVLSAVLTGLRLWNRLTQLAVQGGHRFNILAALNPSQVAVGGVTLDRDELLNFIRRVADEVQTSSSTADKAKGLGFDSEGKKLDLGETAQSHSIAAKLRDKVIADGSAIKLSTSDGATAGLKQGFNSPRNQRVSQPGVPEEERLPPDYESMFKDMPEGQQQGVAQAMLGDLRGQNSGGPAVPQSQRVFLHTLGAVEENRSQSDLVYRALAYDLAATDPSKFTEDQKKFGMTTLHGVVNKLPLAPKGAQGQARQLNLHYAFKELQAKAAKGNPTATANLLTALSKKEGLKPEELQQMTRISKAKYLTARGVSPKERKDTRRIKNDKNASDEAREEARGKLARWDDEYMRHAWEEAAGRGTLEHSRKGDAMADREVKFLQGWAATLDLDFSTEGDPKQALFEMIRRKIHAIYNI